MVTHVKVSTMFHCSLERAFKTPILCDLSKIHTGFGIIPKVTHTTDNDNWGHPGSSKKVHVTRSFTQKGGFSSVDHIVERKENDFWKLRVDNFQSWMLGFSKFEGTWKTTPQNDGKIKVDYAYRLHSKGLMLYPICWLFGNIYWRMYMKHVLNNIKELAIKKEPYFYN